MIRPRKKLIRGIALMIFMVLVLWFIMLIANLLSGSNYMEMAINKGTEDDKYKGITDTVRGFEELYTEGYDRFYARIQVKVDLTANALYKVMSEEKDAGIRKVGKGCVVKIENGEMTVPSGARTGLLRYADMITKDRGTQIYTTPTINGPRKDILVYSHITGPYYYLEIVNGDELYAFIKDYVRIEELLNSVIFVYGVSVDLYCPDHESSRFFFCYPDNVIFTTGVLDLNDPEIIEEIGLFAGQEEAGQNEDMPSILELHQPGQSETVVSYVTEDIEELGCKLILTIPEDRSVLKAIEETSVGFLVIITLCIVFIVFVVSVYHEMFNGLVTKEKKEKYAPGRIRVIAVSFGIVGILAVFGVCMFMRALSNLYEETENLDFAFIELKFMLEEREALEEIDDTGTKTLHIEYARRLAELVENYPYLNDKEHLQKLSEIIGAKYVMFFDANGKEVITSADYINMELGAQDADPPSGTADFRRILKGVPGIAHSTATDEVTGRTLALVGVRTNDRVNGGYGVMIAAMPPEDKVQSETDEIYAILKSVTPTGKICFCVDPNNRYVVYSSQMEERVYYPAEYVGIRDSMIRDGVSDFVVIEGKRYFITSDVDNRAGLIHYFCTPTDMIFGKGIGYSLACAIGFGIVFAILSNYLLSGYSDAAVEEAEKRGPEMPAATGEKAAGNILAKVKYWFSRMTGGITPESAAMITLRTILALTILRLFIDYHRRAGFGQGSLVLDYILAGKWHRGLNLFALTALVMLFCGLSVGMFFIRFVLGTVGNMMGSRGHTICKLIANMIGYLSIIVFFYYALSYLGVDTNAILASVGVMGLGLTMGARDLITDIMAGISLIFGGEYQVGDIVSIDGYRGMVQEVGVRTTKIIGRGGNIKIIGNKDIKNVINLTMLNSWVPITVRVDINYPLRDVETILAEELPRVGNKYKEIISGPYYKGVLSIEAGFAVLSIIAECNEDDYHKVERALVREILLILREKNVPVR